MGMKYSYFFIIYQICNFSIWTHACIWYNKIRHEISLLCIKVPLYKIFSFSSLILKYFCHNMYYQNRTSIENDLGLTTEKNISTQTVWSLSYPPSNTLYDLFVCCWGLQWPCKQHSTATCLCANVGCLVGDRFTAVGPFHPLHTLYNVFTMYLQCMPLRQQWVKSYKPDVRN